MSTGSGLPASPVTPPPPQTRDQSRSRRKRTVRPRTLSLRAWSKRDQAVGAALYPERPGVDYRRPTTRAECAEGPRPCPFVSCRHHLYLEALPNGSIKINFPDLEVDELPRSCALDLADQGGVYLETIGEALNLTRERARQLELLALAKVEAQGPGLVEHLAQAGGAGRLRLPVLPSKGRP